jgi:hypothetical protein
MVLAMTQKLDNSVFGCKYSAPILVPDQARYHSRPHQPVPVPIPEELQALEFKMNNDHLAQP